MAKVSLDGHNITTLVLTPASGTAVTKNLSVAYEAGDEGKVVKNGALVAQSARSSNITVNGTYDTTENNSVTVSVSGGSATLGTKNITADGTYTASSDGYDGYSQVVVSVGSGGGGTVLTGTFTPTENISTYTISALAGTTLNHFLLKPTGEMTNGKNGSDRSATCLFIDFSEPCFFTLSSNASGAGWNNYGSTGTSSSFDAQTGDLDTTAYSFSRSTGTYTCKTPTGNNGGVLLANVSYTWYAW